MQQARRDPPAQQARRDPPAQQARRDQLLSLIHISDTLDALDAHRLDARSMVTETIGLEALPDRFARLERDPDAGKVIVRP